MAGAVAAVVGGVTGSGAAAVAGAVAGTVAGAVAGIVAGSVLAGVIVGRSLHGMPASAATRNIASPNSDFQTMPQKRPLAAPMPTRIACSWSLSMYSSKNAPPNAPAHAPMTVPTIGIGMTAVPTMPPT